MAETLGAMTSSARVLAAQSATAATRMASALDFATNAIANLAHSASDAVVAIDMANAAARSDCYAPHYTASMSAAADAKARDARRELSALVQLMQDSVACAIRAETHAASVTAAVTAIATRARLVQAATQDAGRPAAADEEGALRAASTGRQTPSARATTAAFGGVHKRSARLTEVRRLQDDLYSVLERDDTMRAWMANGSGGRRPRRSQSTRIV